VRHDELAKRAAVASARRCAVELCQSADMSAADCLEQCLGAEPDAAMHRDAAVREEQDYAVTLVG
jgi:hypothetical protein